MHDVRKPLLFCKKLYTAEIPFLVENLEKHLVKDFIKADKMMLVLLILHWFVASTITAFDYGFYQLGLLGGGVTTLIACLAYLFLRGTIYSRIIMAISFMLFSAIFIQQHLGRIEMHFHVFIALAFLIRYKDILPMIAGAITTAIHHLTFNYCQVYDISVLNVPIKVYSYGQGFDITAIHVIFVLIAVVVYYFMIQQISSQFCFNLYISEKYLHANHEKNEFFGVVVHDLKNPLSVIHGVVDMLKTEDNVKQEEIIELIDMIEISSKQMFGLITNLLDVNMIESGKMKVVQHHMDIVPIVRRALKSHEGKAKLKNITLHLQPIESCHAFIDANITYQVLDNLISNAIKYSQYDKAVYIRISAKEQSIQCEVQDQGEGLSAEDQKLLFQKFTRLKPKPTGGEHSTGLGLFIVKKLVEAMQGKVWCKSQVGQGSTFIIELPKAPTNR